MSVLLTASGLKLRRDQLRPDLLALAAGLRDELRPVLDTSTAIPREKALLSKSGGRCSIDGTYLRFDPFDPRHICAQCGREYGGGLHDLFRLYWYQLWLAERTLHCAVLGALLDDSACRTSAATLLDGYAKQYLQFSNSDNVLGPSRPFFSTYLESIWLLQLCIALDVLESTDESYETRALGARVRDHLIAPSAALIASYDEGMSNRQVWNNAALLAASRLLDDRMMFERALTSSSGVQAHLGKALLSDGSWYEGENYHLFAHRGLWYCTQIASTAGYQIPDTLLQRMQEGFATPFRTMLPDLTYPSRRDSQYGVSIRQIRFAESCELGLARATDERLTSVLGQLYDSSVPPGETGRMASSADAERNLPGSGLQRSDLSWRTLLFALAELPPCEPRALESDLLPAQGLGILRRDGGDVYASLDYGHSGGGHGHPDRLNLTLARGRERLFDDVGTGSYVDSTLAWYRSTLAHNAPLVNREQQRRVHGDLVAFEDRSEFGWIRAEAELAHDVHVRRSVVIAGNYIIDELSWESPVPVEVALPFHGVQDPIRAPRIRAQLPVTSSTDDGFKFLKDVEQIATVSFESVLLAGVLDHNRSLRGRLCVPSGADLYSAYTPAAPGRTGFEPMVMPVFTAPESRFTSAWTWDSGASFAVAFRGDQIIVTIGDVSHLHRREDGKWSVENVATGEITGLGGFAPVPVTGAPRLPHSGKQSMPEKHGIPATIELGERHYRQSELSWQAAGGPRAVVTITRKSVATVRVTIDVPKSEHLFVPIDSENHLDNEPASINGDSVQLYARSGSRTIGVLLVPGPRGVGKRTASGWANTLPADATWRRTAEGYVMEVDLYVDPALATLELDAIVNDAAHGRARRRGQLVMSGAAGEYVYLRGDRHDPASLLQFSMNE